MSVNIGVTLTTTKLEAAAGASVETAITIKNQSQIVDQFLVKIEGLDASWWSLSLSSVSLFPGDQDQIKLTVRPPKEAEAKAGSYPFQVRVISQANTQEITTVDAYLVLRGFSAWEAEMSPTKITGRSGTYRIKITNSGNADANVAFEAKDPEEGLVYQFDRSKLVVPPGGVAQASVTVQPKKGEPKKLYSFQVTARPDDMKASSKQAKVLNGQLEYPKGRNLKWLWLLLIIPVVLVIAYFAWMYLSKVDVQVTSPKNADTWEVGSRQTVTWEAEGRSIEAVDLEYSTNGGSTWIFLAQNIANSGSYQITVPLVPFSSSNCVVRVTLKGKDNKKLAQGLSEGIFSINVPEPKVSVTVTNPAGGAKLKADSTVSISWKTTGNGISSIGLEYSSDGGKTWKSIITNTANSGSYSWKIPNVSSTTCYVKVTARDRANKILSSDMNDAPFTLEGKPIFLIPPIQMVPITPAK